MGETEFKYCSDGTFVSEERHPGKRATDCWACPYGRCNLTAYSCSQNLHIYSLLARRIADQKDLRSWDQDWALWIG